MENQITASFDTLMRQAPATVELYWHEAIKVIDNSFSKGYAKQHPELLGTFLQTCARDLHTACLTGAIQQLAAAVGGIGEALDNLAESHSNAVDKHGRGITTALRFLGTGDGITSMGAIEYLATEIRDGCTAVASAIEEHTMAMPKE